MKNKMNLFLAALMVMGNARGAETDLYGWDSLVVGYNSLPAALLAEAELLEEERLLDFGEVSEDGNPLVQMANEKSRDDVPKEMLKSASSAKNSFVCDYEGCGEQFKYPSFLKKHKAQAHKRKNPHQCEICYRKFRGLVALEMHKKVHNGENPYKCSSCEKCFTCSSHLKKHSKIHTGKKDFSCSACGKTFIKKAHKESHEKIHAPARPYECSICPKRFRLKKDLKSHSRSHTGEKSFSCSVCQRSFAALSYRNKHQKKHGKDHLSSNPREDDSDDNELELAAANSPAALVKDEVNGEQDEE